MKTITTTMSPRRGMVVAIFGAITTLAMLTSLTGCSDDPAAEATPDGASDFTSFAPGENGGDGNTKGGAAETASGAAQDNSAAPKIEEGDVARMWGDKLLILNRWRGLQVVDLADAKAPKLIGRVPMYGTPREMYVAGDHVTVLLSQVHKASAKDGGGVETFAGSEVRVIALGKGSDAKELSALSLPGWVSASKRIDNQLIVVAANTNWNPWYWGGCYGPYPCAYAAEGGAVTTGAGGVSSTDVAVGGGMSIGGPYGYNAAGGTVHVFDQTDIGASKAIGSVAFEGGLQWIDIAPGDVVLYGTQYSYDSATKKSTTTNRLTQIAIAAGKKPEIAAKWQDVVDASDGSSSNLYSAARMADGRLVLVFRAYAAGKSSLSVQYYKVVGDKFEKTVTWSDAEATWWSQIAIIGDKLVVAGTVSETVATGKDDEPGKDGEGGGDDSGGKTPGGEPDEPTPSTPGGAPGVPTTHQTKQHTTMQVISLADAATITLVGMVKLGDNSYLYGAIQALPNVADSALVGWRDSTGKSHLDRLTLSDAKLHDGLLVGSDTSGWFTVEALPTGLLVLATQSYNGDAKGYESALRLLTVGKDGAFTEHGKIASKLAFWSQLKSIDSGKLLLRIANQALEVIDKQDLKKPAVIATLELAADVRDVTWLGGTEADGGRAIALVYSWMDGKHHLRTLKKGSTDELDPAASIVVEPGWARMYTHGKTVWLADYQGLYGYDFSDPDNPKAAGTYKIQAGSNSAGSNSGESYSNWNPWELVQSGATLFAVGRSGKFVADDPTTTNCKDNEATSGGGSSAGSAGSGGVPSTDPPAPDTGDGEKDAGGSDPGSDAGGTDEGEKSEPDKPANYCTGKTVWTTIVRAISVADPAKPATIGELKIEGASWYWGVRLAGDKLYMTHYESLKTTDGKWYGKYWLDRIDVSDPKKPLLLDKTNVPGQVIGLSDDGKTAFTIDWLTAKDSKPEEYKIESWLNALTLHKGKAYLQSKVLLPGQQGATALTDKALYVSTWQYPWTLAKGADGKVQGTPKQQLLTYDLTSIKALKLASELDTGAGITALFPTDKRLYATIGWGTGLLSLNLTKPLEPAFGAFLPLPGYSFAVVESPDSVYVPSGYYGVAKYSLK